MVIEFRSFSSHHPNLYYHFDKLKINLYIAILVSRNFKIIHRIILIACFYI